MCFLETANIPFPGKPESAGSWGNSCGSSSPRVARDTSRRIQLTVVSVRRLVSAYSEVGEFALQVYGRPRDRVLDTGDSFNSLISCIAHFLIV